MLDVMNGIVGILELVIFISVLSNFGYYLESFVNFFFLWMNEEEKI